jgi:hypothetical protein
MRERHSNQSIGHLVETLTHATVSHFATTEVKEEKMNDLEMDAIIIYESDVLKVIRTVMGGAPLNPERVLATKVQRDSMAEWACQTIDPRKIVDSRTEKIEK